MEVLSVQAKHNILPISRQEVRLIISENFILPSEERSVISLVILLNWQTF